MHPEVAGLKQVRTEGYLNLVGAAITPETHIFPTSIGVQKEWNAEETTAKFGSDANSAMRIDDTMISGTHVSEDVPFPSINAAVSLVG